MAEPDYESEAEKAERNRLREEARDRAAMSRAHKAVEEEFRKAREATPPDGSHSPNSD